MTKACRAAAGLAPAIFLAAMCALAAQTAHHPPAAFETALSEARAMLEQGEPQLAESHFRTARLEAWNLLGLLAVVDGELDAAREAFTASGSSATAGVYRPQMNLALLDMQRGESVAALIQLRVLTDRFPTLEEPWKALTKALVLNDRFEEAREISDKLRHTLPETGDELTHWLAGLDRETLDDVIAPRIDLGTLTDQSPRERRRLRQHVEKELVQIDASLATLGDSASPTETLRNAMRSIRGTHGELVSDLENGRLEDAAVRLQRAREQNPDDPVLERLREFVDRARRGTVSGLLQQAELLRHGTSPKAMTELLRRAFELAPSSEEVLLAYGRAGLEARLVDGALSALAPLAGLHPEVAVYHELHGRALLLAQSVTEAIDALHESVRLNPDVFSTRLLLGQTLSSEKRFDEAEAQLHRALELVPGNLEAQAALAAAEQGQGDLGSAERRAQNVLSQAPNHAGARFVLGMVRMKQKRWAEARRALEGVVSQEPRHIQALYQLSLACMRLGDRENAQRHLEAYQRVQRGATLMTAVSGPVMQRQ